jgi:RND family efflux transporter MFP subunit
MSTEDLPEKDAPWPSGPHPGVEAEPRPDETASFRRTGRLVGFGALLVLICALAYGGWQAYERHRAVMKTSQQRADFVPTLPVATVKPSAATFNIALPATTEAFTTANMFARVSGYISQRKVDIGDRVKKGDLLAYISAPEIEYQLAQAEATLAQMQATVHQNQAGTQLAQITDERNGPLVNRGFVSALNGDTYRLNVKSTEAQLKAARANVVAQEAQVRVARQQRDYQSVVAPFDGVITQRKVNIGDLMQGDATSGTFMFTVMQSDVIRTQVYVPQDQAFGLAPGVKAIVRVPQMPGRTFPGTVTRIADALAPGTRTLLTEVDIANPDGALTPGTYVTVELFIPRKSPSLLIPAQAVFFDANGMQVAVAKNGVANIQTVNVTRDLGTAIEVDHGVKAGDQVIISPPVNLRNGDRVHIRAPDKPVKKASAK